MLAGTWTDAENVCVHEAYYSCDFYNGECKLCFAVSFDAEHVNKYNGDEEYGDKYCSRELVVPIAYRD